MQGKVGRLSEELWGASFESCGSYVAANSIFEPDRSGHLVLVSVDATLHKAETTPQRRNRKIVDSNLLLCRRATSCSDIRCVPPFETRH